MIANKALPITQHLHELKRRILYCLLMFAACCAVAVTYSSNILIFIAQPLQSLSPNTKMIYTAMGEGFMVQLKLAIYVAVFASFPFWLLQIYKFIAPGLKLNEKKIVRFCFILAPFLFLLGVLFLYYVVMPMLWQFFTSFQVSDGVNSVVLHAKISEYLSLCLSLALSFGLSFQLPVVVIILTKLKLITQRSLRSKRKYAIVLIFVIAAVLTPPDVISQVCLAIPLLLLYEISIILSKYA